MSEFMKIQQESRANLIEQVREVLDFAEGEGRGLTAEELQKTDRIEADIRRIDETLSVARRNEERKADAVEAARGFVPPVAESRDDNAVLRSIANGELRSFEFAEQRAALTGTAGTGVVPYSFYAQVFDILQNTNPLFTTSTIITTEGGNTLQVPQITARSSFAITGQGTAIAESNPTFSNINLGAWKYGALVSLSNELIADAGVNLTSLIANISATEIAFDAGAGLTTGTGTVQPTGIVTAAGSGVVGGTGVAGAPSYENLVDLAYSVAGDNRARYGFMASTSAIAAIRKIKDGNGAYIFSPSISVDGRDYLLGTPIYENPSMAAVGTGAKSIVYGKLDAFIVRQAGGIQVATSSDYAFDKDVTTFRVTWRGDSNLATAGAIKYFQGAAS
jgi:HK97 family phage major capsid protein